MANIMVEDEEFRSSHPDLQQLNQGQQDSDSSSSDTTASDHQHEQQQQYSNRENRGIKRQSSIIRNPMQHPLKNSPRKSVEFALDQNMSSSIDNMRATFDSCFDSDGTCKMPASLSAVNMHRYSSDSHHSAPTHTSENKKARHCASLAAKQLVEALFHSITPSERLEAICRIKDCFEHDVQALHSDEIAAEADIALTKHIVFLTTNIHNVDKRMSHGTHILEIMHTCEAIESIYRASSETVGSSFEQCGQYLLHALINVINDEMQRRCEYYTLGGHSQQRASEDVNSHDDHNQHAHHDTVHHANKAVEAMKKERNDESAEKERTDKQDPSAHQRPATPPLHDMFRDGGLPGSFEGDVILRKATRTFGHFARVGMATRTIAHYPGLLGCLVKLISIQPQDCVPWEARLSGLWTIANLACNNENMQMMACTPGLINALICISCRTLQADDALERTMEILRSRSITARAVFNLSYLPENKITLSEHTSLVDLLSELTVHRSAPLSRSETVRDIMTNTRRYAIGALRNLAAAPKRTKILLCKYKNGRLFDVLTDAALYDTDNKVRDRAYAAINNLANQETAELIIKHPALILALKSVLSSDDDKDNNADNQEGTPKSHASATLLVLKRAITPSSREYSNLQSLLDAINPSTDGEGVCDDVKQAAEV